LACQVNCLQVAIACAADALAALYKSAHPILTECIVYQF
jgi:hypothetical protein